MIALVTVPLAGLLYRDPPRGDDSPGGGGEPERVAGRCRMDAGRGIAQPPILGRLRDVGPRSHRVPDRDHPPGRSCGGAGLRSRHARVGIRFRRRVYRCGQPARRSTLDRWGRGWIFTLGSAIGIAGIGCLARLDGPQDLPMLLLYAASGLGFGMRIALLTTIPAELFAGRHLGAILGAANGGGGLGGFIGLLPRRLALRRHPELRARVHRRRPRRRRLSHSRVDRCSPKDKASSEAIQWDNAQCGRPYPRAPRHQRSHVSHAFSC